MLEFIEHDGEWGASGSSGTRYVIQVAESGKYFVLFVNGKAEISSENLNALMQAAITLEEELKKERHETN